MARKRSDRSQATPQGPDPGATGSIDVQFSHTAMPRAEDAPAGGIPPEVSGSVDVQFSGPLPQVTEGESAPAPRPRRQRPRTVPGIIAESISNLPVVKEVMPKTRRGRVMVRSVVVAFSLIGLWIGFIIYFQTRGEMKPDLRPQVEAIFVQMRGGEGMDERIAALYEGSSERLQEIMLEETLEKTIKDQHETLGDFIEVAAVIRTETFRGPSGKTARADLLLDFENGRCQGNMSFREEDGEWRMLGFRVELPEDLAAVATSPEKRAKRVEAPVEVVDQAIKILEMSRDERWREIYDGAAQVFRDAITFEKFEELEKQRLDTLGKFRFLKVTGAPQMSPSGTGASVVGLATFGESLTQQVSMKFIFEDGAWKLSFYKVILPIPHGPKKQP